MVGTQRSWLCTDVMTLPPHYFYDSNFIKKSLGSSVSIVTKLQAGRLGMDSQQGQGFSSSRHSVQTGYRAHLSSYYMSTRELFRRGKAVEA
jgi:hypothetical protein